MASPFTPVEVEGIVVDLLLDMAHHGFRPEVPEQNIVVDGRWEALDLGEYTSRLVLEDEELQLAIEAPPDKVFGPLYRMMQVRNQPASLTLSNGHEVEAELAHMTSLGAAADVRLHHWTWTTRTTPSFWVGQLKGRLPAMGNLSLVERANTWLKTGDGFRLDGYGTWYVVRTETESEHLVVLVPQGRFDRDAVVHDILCMEFAFGASLRLGHLVGIDDHRRFSGAVSTGHLLRPSGKHRVPVPDGIQEAAATVPRLFHLLATTLHDEGLEPLILAIASYLDSIHDHLDGGYLKAQVGLEAFANRLTDAGTPELLLDDEKAYPEWKRWVKSLRSKIREFVTDKASAEIVRDKFVKAAWAPSGDRVARALQQAGVSIPAEAHDEIGKRNYPAHGFLMNRNLDQHEFDRDVQRLEMIQTLLAALVATHVGYDGPLKGYVVDEHGGRPSPDWWPTEEQGKWQQFRCERTSDAESPP